MNYSLNLIIALPLKETLSLTLFLIKINFQLNKNNLIYFLYVQSSDLTTEQHSVYFKTFQVFQDLLHV